MDWSYIWFSGEGRIGRREYWLGGVLPVVVAALVVGVVGGVLNAFAEQVGTLFAVFPLLFLGYVLVRVSVKRWHDVGLSGWFFLLECIPFLGLLVTVGLGLVRGQEGRNKFERM